MLPTETGNCAGTIWHNYREDELALLVKIRSHWRSFLRTLYSHFDHATESPMSKAPASWLAPFALLAVLSATACAKAPSTDKDQTGIALFGESSIPRTVGGHTYTSQAVEATLGPHRFMFPANFYYNQIGPFADGGVMLTVFWPGFEAAPPGDRPVRTTQDSRRQVLIELYYLDRVPITNYLARRSSNEATTEAGSLERRNPVERLDLRVAQPDRWELTPYAIDRSLLAAYARDSEQNLGVPYVHNPSMEPDWYVARSRDGQLSTFISCDPADRIPDGLFAHGKMLERADGDRVAMCSHSLVDLDDSITIEMSYARVMLRDWKRLEATVRNLLRRYRVKP